MSLNIHGYIKLARVLADQAGLTIQFIKDSEPTAYTDGRTLFLPRPNAMASEDELTEWLYTLFHEIGHNHPKSRDCFGVAKRYNVNMKSFLGRTLNYVEDIRQELVEHDRYRGKQQIMSKGRAIFDRKMVNNIATFNWTGEKQPMMSGALWAWGEDKRTFFQPAVAGVGETIKSHLPPEAHNWVDEIRAGDYWDVLKDKNATPETSYEISVRIIREVFKLKDEDSGIQHEPGQPDPNGGESDDEGQSEDKRKVKQNKNKGKGDEKAQRIETEMDVLFKDIEHVHSDELTERNQKAGQYRIIYEDSDIFGNASQFKVTPENEVILYDYTKNKSGGLVGGRSTRFRRTIESMNTGKILSAKVRRLLEIYSRSTHIYGQKKGKIHSKNLYRASMQEAKGFNERVFKQRKDNFTLDNAVSLLVDFSGSMQSGYKIENACKSAMLLLDALAPLRIPVEIAGFTEASGRQVHALFKAFNTKVTEQQLIDYFEDMTGVMKYNADGESLLYAYKRLTERKEQRKLLIVLSDGRPSAHHHASQQPAFLKYVAGEIEKRKNVELYAIGIQSRSVQSFYKDYRVIQNADELEEAVLSVIKRKILNL